MALSDRALKATAMRLLLPGLLLNITVGNQLWTVGPFYVGQFIFWPLIACAAFIVLVSFPRGGWSFLLVLAVLATRALGANASSGWYYLLYAVPLSALFLLAGAVAAAQKRDRVFRQLRLYLVLTVPFMLLQVAGTGSWTLALNTETTAVPVDQIEQARTVYPTLFVPQSEVRYAIGQGRPAGFMHSNNILSLAIIFGFALQFGRIRSPRVTWTDVLFCAAMVLAMAKIAILVFLVMVTWLLLKGSRIVKKRIRGVVALTVLLYGVYMVFFPGVFLTELSAYRIGYSVFIRLGDIATILSADGPGRAMLETLLEGTPTYQQYGSEEDIGSLSGYASILRFLPFLLPLAALGFVAFWRGVRGIKERAPAVTRLAILVLVAIVIYPAAVPIWRAPFYWFVAGFAFVPVMTLFLPRLRDDIVPTPVRA